MYNQIKSNIISPTVSEPVVTNYGCLENDFLMDSYCLCKPGSKLHSFHSIFVDPQFEDDRIFNLKCKPISPENEMWSFPTYPSFVSKWTNRASKFSICTEDSNKFLFDENQEACNNSFIVGMESFEAGEKEKNDIIVEKDRYFRFYFVSLEKDTWELTSCSEVTDGDYQKTINVTLQENQVFTGIMSTFQSADRKFVFRVCTLLNKNGNNQIFW